MLLHVDGWLCEIKDVQIRDGLHILGQKPTGETELDLVLAILRARQLFGGDLALPGLRQALGLTEDGTDERTSVDRAEAAARGLVAALQAAGWDPDTVGGLTDNADVAAVLRFAAIEVVPAWPAATPKSTSCCGLWTATSSRPVRPGRRCAAWSTCYPPVATSTPWTPRRCRRGWHGKPVWRLRIRCSRATGPTTARGRSR